MKIAFHDNTLNIRGTSVALYDYAHYNEILLGNKSIILTPRKADHDDMAVHKFSRRFQVIYYNNISEIDSILEREKVDFFYVIKYGKNDGVLSRRVKTGIHCVFDMSEPHGNVYAAVSDTLAKKFGMNIYVPHMIGLQPSSTGENMRKSLKIPLDATVLGRHGGQDTFDLSITKNAIIRAVNTRNDLYFLFVNTPCFYNHPRVIHLDKIVDSDEKNRFISTCNGMIHAQSMGETYGIAIGEFSVNNKPIISYNGNVWNDNYKKILGDKALWYTTEENCYQILVSFDKSKYEDLDLNCYKAYTPENVMKIFKRVFLD
jgi:hypothetical protein